MRDREPSRILSLLGNAKEGSPWRGNRTTQLPLKQERVSVFYISIFSLRRPIFEAMKRRGTRLTIFDSTIIGDPTTFQVIRSIFADGLRHYFLNYSIGGKGGGGILSVIVTAE